VVLKSRLREEQSSPSWPNIPTVRLHHCAKQRGYMLVTLMLTVALIALRDNRESVCRGKDSVDKDSAD